MTSLVLNRRSSELTASSAEAAFDMFGGRLHVLASVLTDDAELAERLVMQAVLEHDEESGSHQELSRHLHLAWLSAGGPSRRGDGSLPSDQSVGSGMLLGIRRLSPDQRAALGLCAYGDHNLRQAADAMAVSPRVVAELLEAAMRGLSGLRLGGDREDPAA